MVCSTLAEDAPTAQSAGSRDVAARLRAMLASASPETRELVAEVLRLERDKAHMANPRNIVPEITTAIELAVKDNL